MAGFEGVKWASQQMRYLLEEKKFDLLEANAKVFAVSRSIHYGLCLAFEGIRFFLKKNTSGALEANFLNWHLNLDRLRRGIAFNLGAGQQHLVPSAEEMTELFIHRYFEAPSMRAFFEDMAEIGVQGYLRPFTVDEEQSIGVTFPGRPAIRAVVCQYDRYLGEPFTGVVVPHLVRAMGINKTGCLKLGINYLMSIKAVEEARKIRPQAASALFLDDRPHAKLEERNITEWDSSCCLFALKDGRVVKIPESPLILPSVTIRGITAILREMGIPVEERNLSYGELIRLVKSGELVVVCSIGTAGILNRCHELVLVDENQQEIAIHKPKMDHEIYQTLGAAKQYYWNIYRERVAASPGLKLDKYNF